MAPPDRSPPDSRARVESPATAGSIVPADSGGSPPTGPGGPGGRPAAGLATAPPASGGGTAGLPAPAMVPPVPVIALAIAPGGPAENPADGPEASVGPAGQVAAGRGFVVSDRGAVAEGDAWGPRPGDGSTAGVGDGLALRPGRGDTDLRGDETASGADGPAPRRDGHRADVPDPEGAGPRTAFAPFDRAALERVLDCVLEELGGLGDVLPAAPGPIVMGLAPATLALAAGTLAAVAAHRSRRSLGDADRPPGPVGLAFPGLPSSWDGSRR